MRAFLCGPCAEDWPEGTRCLTPSGQEGPAEWERVTKGDATFPRLKLNPLIEAALECFQCWEPIRLGAPVAAYCRWLDGDKPGPWEASFLTGQSTNPVTT